jgi:hypothetical protein
MNDFSCTGWRKSSYSNSSANCVEVAFSARRARGPASDQPPATSQVVGIRDSKQYGSGPVLEFSAAAWNTFLTTTKARVAGR